MQTAVSVIIPAFNAAEFISVALESALRQTLTAIEILVTDDASTDSTAQVVENFARRDTRIRLLRHSHNRGAAAARNTGLQVAVGDWIASLDADDAYMPRRLELLVEAAAARGADMMADNVMLVDFPGRTPLEMGFAPSGRLFERPVSLQDFLRLDTPGEGRFSMGYLKPLIRRSFLKRHGLAYSERIAVSEDFALYVECLIRGARLHLMPQAHYSYSIRPGSLSNDAKRESGEESAALNAYFLRHPMVAERLDWAGAFEARQTRIDAHLAYRAWTAALKQGNLRSAGEMLLTRPQLGARFACCLPGILERLLLRRPYRLRGAVRVDGT